MTTRLGIRPIVVSAPFTTPHAMPMPMPTRNAMTIAVVLETPCRWPNIVPDV